MCKLPCWLKHAWTGWTKPRLHDIIVDTALGGIADSRLISKRKCLKCGQVDYEICKIEWVDDGKSYQQHD